MTILSSIKARRLQPTIAALEAQYDSEFDRETRLAKQLERLNRSWAAMLSRSRLAKAMQDRYRLPEQFASFDAFCDRVPVQRKEDLKELMSAVGQDIGEQAEWRSTGGTTSQPFTFPVSGEEQSEAAGIIWYARKHFGVGPADRTFMIWGHSHLLGSGVKGRIARFRRELADRLLGYCRYSAYDLRPEAMRAAADALIAHRARYVIGYSYALDCFARVNVARADDIRKLGLAVVIATGEGFPEADSRGRIEGVFGCPVIMEYGAVETGPVAYEYTAGRYSSFWGSFFLEGMASPTVPDAQELVVTSLGPRAMPLFRYWIGDLVVAAPDEEDLNVGFQSVIGRCNNLLEMPDGRVIHSEAISHVVRDIKGINAYQFVLRADRGAPALRYEAARALSEEDQARMRTRFAKIDASLTATRFDHVAALPPTVAGKRAMVVWE